LASVTSSAYHTQYTQHLEMSQSQIQREPFRISPVRSPTWACRLLQLINNVLLAIIAKLIKPKPANSAHSIAHLPLEVVLLIAGMLELHDRASLCLTNKDFMFILGNTLELLQHDKPQRIEFQRVNTKRNRDSKYPIVS